MLRECNRDLPKTCHFHHVRQFSLQTSSQNSPPERERAALGLLGRGLFSKTAALPGLSSCARNTPSGKRSTAGTRRALPSSQHAACPCPCRTRVGWEAVRNRRHAQPAAGGWHLQRTRVSASADRRRGYVGASKAVGPESKSVVRSAVNKGVLFASDSISLSRLCQCSDM